MPILTVQLTSVQMLALAAFGVTIGTRLKKAAPLLDRLNIPAAIIGGLIYAVTAVILRDRYLNLEMDLTLQNILMIAFFTTIGMGASLRLLRDGGLHVLYFFGLATVGAILQNIVGIGMAKAFSLSPLLGIISGSVALTGGPATALAFGDTFERTMGVQGATSLGIAAAMFGISAGGVLGGYIGGSLIRRYNLVSEVTPGPHVEQIIYQEDMPEPEPSLLDDQSDTERSALLSTVITIAVAMGLGSLISAGFERMGLILPTYLGSMIAAAVIRNLDDRFHFVSINQHDVDRIGSVALYLFIVMALLTLRLWELAYLALPTLVMLLTQILLIWILCKYVVYRLMGRDFDAAVMAAGFCGFMLGTTANAMACMDVLTQKHGPAHRAYVVVPIVGAFLIDFTNAIVIMTMANVFR